MVKEKPVNLSVKVQAARQLFLYGDTTGKRILEPIELAERVGCSAASVWSYVKEWSKEFEDLLIQANGFELGTVLSDEDVKVFKETVQFSLKQKKNLEFSLENTENFEISLLSIIKNKEVTPETEEKFLDMVEKLCSVVHTKAKLQQQWIAMNSQWVKLSGIEGKMDIAHTAEKERAKGRVKMDLKKEEAGDNPAPRLAKGKTAGGLFEVD